MTRLFIQIKDGDPYEHPISEDNFRQAFPQIDVNDLPPEFAEFERVDVPVINVYEIYQGATYEWQDNKVKDVHHVRSMTDQEKLDLQNEIKERWKRDVGFFSWVFQEETCLFVPPSPRPADGKNYIWDESIQSWVDENEFNLLQQTYPNDGKKYRWDNITSSWIQK